MPEAAQLFLYLFHLLYINSLLLQTGLLVHDILFLLSVPYDVDENKMDHQKKEPQNQIIRAGHICLISFFLQQEIQERVNCQQTQNAFVNLFLFQPLSVNLSHTGYVDHQPAENYDERMDD